LHIHIEISVMLRRR